MAASHYSPEAAAEGQVGQGGGVPSPDLVPDNESSEEEQDTPHLKDQAGHPESSAEDPLDRTSGLIPEEEHMGVSEEVLESAGASRRTMAQCVSTGLESEAYS